MILSSASNPMVVGVVGVDRSGTGAGTLGGAVVVDVSLDARFDSDVKGSDNICWDKGWGNEGWDDKDAWGKGSDIEGSGKEV